MKSAKNANYWQVDHKVKSLSPAKGVEIFESPEAWEKFSWTRKYFTSKPKEGYFIWVQEQVDLPLVSCISIMGKNVKQELGNLMVIESGLNISMKGTCNSLHSGCGQHKAKGKIIIKDRASLKYGHFHTWGKKDSVQPEYDFILGKEAKLEYSYKMISGPEKLKVKTRVELAQKAVCILKVVADCSSTKAEIEDELFLQGRDSSGQIEQKLVAREGAEVSAVSAVSALAECKGHLDCQGLLVDPAMGGRQPILNLVPKLACKNSKAQLTHEAAIGRISSEQLDYLMMRGLSEKEAVDLIINGFLNS